MVSTIVSPVFVSDLLMGIVFSGCILLMITCELADDKLRPIFRIFSNNLAVFSVPLLVLFMYLAILWAANILSR